MSQALQLLQSNINAERARVADLQRRLDEAQRELEGAKGKGGALLCRQCGVAKRERVFVPCGHFHFCAACSKPMAQCGTCRQHILGKVPAKMDD